MAKRRMFSTDIIDSDSFLDMPATSKCLYYDLGMRADDDGFISPRKVLRLTNAGVDDLNILIAKNFVIPFESGVVVIRDWKMNNYIRSDRYAKTIYKEEKKLLSENDNHQYVLKDGVKELASTIGIPNVNQLVDKRDTQVRLGKDRIGKDRKENTLSKDKGRRSVTVDHVLKEFERLWGFEPTDTYQKPRWVASILVRQLQSMQKSKGKEVNDETTCKAITFYLEWAYNEDWSEKIQKLETLRSKLSLFKAEYKLK